MAKIKTRELILDVALILFNDRGESIVTSVDLANEMNISPGNLYYHFKGKEEVVEELYAQFHARVLITLQEITSQSNKTTKQTLAGLAVLSDVLQQFKFISQDVRGVNERYPNLRDSLQTIFSFLEQSLKVLVSQVVDASDVIDSEDASQLLTDNLLYTLINYGSYDALLNRANEQKSHSIEQHLYLHFLPFL